MIKINLISEGRRPAAVRKKRVGGASDRDWAPLLLLVFALASVLAAGVWWYLLSSQLKEKREEVRQAEATVRELEAVIKKVEDFKIKKAELEHKIGVINELKLNQRGPVRVMDNISRALPELLWLDRMTMSTSSIELAGRAYNPNAVATFLEGLDRVPEFQEPLVRDIASQGQIVSFQIQFNYSYATLAQSGTEGDAGGLSANVGGAGGR